MKMKLELTSYFVGAGLLVGLGAWLSFGSFRQVEFAGTERLRSFVLLNRANDWLSSLKDAETGYRGYLLTRDPAYLVPYVQVRDDLQARLEALRQLTLDAPSRKYLDALVPEVDAFLARMVQGIDQRRAQSAPPVAGLGEGKRQMDAIRLQMGGFIQLEQALRAQRETTFEAELHRMLLGLWATSLLTLMLALTFAYSRVQASRRRFKRLIQEETQHLLEAQRELNGHLERTNAALQEKEELLAVTLHSIGDAVLTTGLDGCLQSLNSVAEELTGWTQAESMGRPVDEVFRIINQETRQPAITPIRETLAKGTIHGLANHTILVARDGRECAIADSCAPIRDRAGRVIGAVLVFRDVTQDYASQQALRESTAMIQLMVESVVDYAIVMLDPGGRVVSWNGGAQRLKGYREEDILGQHVSRFYSPEDVERGKPQQDLDRVAAEGRFEDEGWRARKDGSAFWANEVFTAIRDPSGHLLGFAHLTQDLTERRKVEAELTEARATAEKANLAKSYFLSSMSHELRSPLNGILGFAQLLETETPPPRASQKESIAQILKAGWHLLTLINEILDLAKVESGQIPMSREPVSMAEVVMECQGMMEPQARAREIRLDCPAPTQRFFVLADRTRVKQVLLNLVSNAIKYNVEGGAITVECVDRGGGRVRISVRDTGRGLAPNQVAQLFQPFNRLGQEAGGAEGTGIGLVVAKRLVELMDGVIGVESEVGVGSVFWFELFAVAEPALALEGGASEAATAAPGPRGARIRTVLYVEDNPANLKLVELIMARHPDIRLLTAINGNSGIELARSSEVDVILLDINLPGMNGFEVLKFLRSTPATAAIPVLAISANAMTSDVENGLKAGFFRYLTKPIRVDEFMAGVNEALAFAEQAGPGTPGESHGTARSR